MTWPTDRPGVPLNPERDGWHWLRTPDDQTAPYEWRTAGECERGRWPSHWVSGVDEWKGTDCAYLGPCPTPDDLDAAVQAERVRAAKMLDDAASRHRTSAVKPSSIVESQAHELAAALLQLWANAIHMETDAPALDAALAKARREGMEAAAKIVAASGLNGPGYAAIILAAMAGAPKEYDHRDNTPHDMAAGAAIRSAAAGEEGK